MKIRKSIFKEKGKKVFHGVNGRIAKAHAKCEKRNCYQSVEDTNLPKIDLTLF